jgi:hypothetical protein
MITGFGGEGIVAGGSEWLNGTENRQFIENNAKANSYRPDVAINIPNNYKISINSGNNSDDNDNNNDENDIENNNNKESSSFFSNFAWLFK